MQPSLAVKALEDVAKDTRHASARVSAARSIIELSQRAIELEELEQRIEQLELEEESSLFPALDGLTQL